MAGAGTVLVVVMGVANSVANAIAFHQKKRKSAPLRKRSYVGNQTLAVSVDAIITANTPAY